MDEEVARQLPGIILRFLADEDGDGAGGRCVSLCALIFFFLIGRGGRRGKRERDAGGVTWTWFAEQLAARTAGWRLCCLYRRVGLGVVVCTLLVRSSVGVRDDRAVRRQTFTPFLRL